MVWKHAPAHNMTMEYWFKITDGHQLEHYIVVYSALDTSVTPSYLQPNEISMSFGVVGFKVWRADLQRQCKGSSDLVCARGMGSLDGWVHTALSFSVETSEILLYHNGDFVWREAFPPAAPILPNGHLGFGQDPDTFLGSYDENQAFSGLIDEFRVWDVIRTPAEIKAWYNRAIPYPAPHLNLYFNFDVAGSKSVPDLSGSGLNLDLGKLAIMRNELTYQTGRKDTYPTSPQFVVSGAPLFGSAPLVKFVSGVGGRVEILLKAASTTGGVTTRITRLPAFGALYQEGQSSALAVNDPVIAGADPVSKVVTYQANGRPRNDSFMYTVTDSTGTASGEVTVLELTIPQPKNLEFTTLEDTVGYIVLGEVTNDGRPLKAKITRLPERGRLYYIEFTSAQETYTAIETDVSKLTAVTEGEVLEDPSGAVVFAPDKDQSSSPGVVYTWFNFSWVDGDLESGAAQVVIHVTAVNDAPRSADIDLSMRAAEGALLEVVLNSTDLDPTFSPLPYYTISSWPKFGRLFQITEDGHMGAEILYKQHIPEVLGYAVEVMNASSQYSLCGGDCFYPYKHCHDCHTDRWHAIQILGPPNSYPEHHMNDKAMEFELADNFDMHEFVELKMQDLAWVNKITVYESFQPGAITRLATAVEYKGPDTQWETVYQGEPIQTLLGSMTANAFNPPLCPLPRPSQYVRFEVDTAAQPSWEEYDAVSVVGTFEPAIGQVTNAQGRIAYQPLPGLHSEHGLLDSFSFIATDCVTSTLKKDAGTVFVRVDPPLLSVGNQGGDGLPLVAGEGWFFFEKHLPVELSSHLTVTLNVTRAIAHFTSVVGISVAAAEKNSTVVLHAVSDLGSTQLWQVEEGNEANVPLTAGLEIHHPSVQIGVTTPFLDEQHRTQPDIALDVWVKLRVPSTGSFVVYRIRYMLTMRCPGKHWNSTLIDPSAPRLCMPCQEDDDDCISCPAGSHWSDQHCETCPPGSFSHAGAEYCKDCDEYSYADTAGSSSCVSCPPNSVRGRNPLTLALLAGSDITHCVCERGFWAPNGQAGVGCLECPDGGECPGSGDMPFPLPGYWALPELPTEFYSCRPRESCLGGPDFRCAEDRVGRMCKTCAPGYFTAGMTCRECPEGRIERVLTAVITVLLIALFWAFVNVTCTSIDAAAVGLMNLQILSQIQHFELEWHPMLWPVHSFFYLLEFNTNAFVAVSCISDFSYTQTTLLQVLLPLLGAGIGLVVYGFAYLHFRLRPIHVDPTAAAASRLRRQSRRQAGVLSISMPWEFSLPRTADALKDLKETCLRQVLNLQFVVYIAVGTRSLGVLLCQDLPSGESFMVHEPDLLCGDPAHLGLVWIGVIGTAVHLIGMPLVLTGGLLFVRLRDKQFLERDWFVRQFGFLVSRFKPEFFYFELVLLARRLFLSLIRVVFVANPLAQATVGMLVLGVSLVVQNATRPYADPKLQTMDTLAICLAIFYIYFGVLFTAGLKDSKPLGAVCVVLCVFSLVSVFGVVLIVVLKSTTARRASMVINQRVGVRLERIRTQFHQDCVSRLPKDMSVAGMPADEVDKLMAHINDVLGDRNIDLPSEGKGQDDKDMHCALITNLWHRYLLQAMDRVEPCGTAAPAVVAQHVHTLLPHDQSLDHLELRDLNLAVVPEALLAWARGEQGFRLLSLFCQVDSLLGHTIINGRSLARKSGGGEMWFMAALCTSYPWILDWACKARQADCEALGRVVDALLAFRNENPHLNERNMYSSIISEPDRGAVLHFLLSSATPDDRKTLRVFLDRVLLYRRPNDDLGVQDTKEEDGADERQTPAAAEAQAPDNPRTVERRVSQLFNAPKKPDATATEFSSSEFSSAPAPSRPVSSPSGQTTRSGSSLAVNVNHKATDPGVASPPRGGQPHSPGLRNGAFKSADGVLETAQDGASKSAPSDRSEKARSGSLSKPGAQGCAAILNCRPPETMAERESSLPPGKALLSRLRGAGLTVGHDEELSPKLKITPSAELLSPRARATPSPARDAAELHAIALDAGQEADGQFSNNAVPPVHTPDPFFVPVAPGPPDFASTLGDLNGDFQQAGRRELASTNQSEEGNPREIVMAPVITDSLGIIDLV